MSVALQCVAAIGYDVPCYSPITPKRRFRSGGAFGHLDHVPCGQCIGCRLERSRQWAVRMMHEAQMHDESHFVTLTYSDSHLPSDYSLSKSVLQKFFKRARKLFPFRYYACGEYGDTFLRPHYHMILFGAPLSSELVPAPQSGLYLSPTIMRLWPFGFSSVGRVTFESAAYVARYCVKKITGAAADNHYDGRLPEFSLMSRKPGIGAAWLDSFHDDVFPSDEVIMRGRPMRPPRYYVKRLPEDEQVAYRERIRPVARSEVSTSRLLVKEEVALAKLSTTKRKLK